MIETKVIKLFAWHGRFESAFSLYKVCASQKGGTRLVPLLNPSENFGQ